ncbi:MAG: histidinol dehydrogenase [Akkermansia sp.]|nr:histidinol dehydrogenase [Akkermansia sp.]
MNIYRESDTCYAAALASMNRRAVPGDDVQAVVSEIIAEVQSHGDEALCAYAARFDRVELSPEALRVTEAELAEAQAVVPQDVKDAIAASLANIEYFSHQSMRRDWSGTNAQGCEVGERFVPYDRVGIYVPGGKAPLVSTALMTGGFAKAVGVPEIVAMTPCGPDGKVNPAVLVALQAAGATEIYRVGGAQGVAALALGTQSIAPVQKIFGPGNRFVVEAKRQLVGAVAIDLLPGPSEVMVLADETANAEYVAADLLAQAEHGGDSVIAFVTTSEELLQQVEAEIARQAATLSRSSYLQQVLAENADCLLVSDLTTGADIVNNFAPEHLVLVVAPEREEEMLARIRTAGAIYAGTYATVACGDFLAGPSHTLPTGGSGKSFSGIRADQFQRRTSIVRMSREAAQRSLPHVQVFARVEGLDAHGRSLELRTL